MNTAILMTLVLASGNIAETIIDTCTKTSSDADRIACLEAAILMRDTEAQVDPPGPTLDAGPADSSGQGKTAEPSTAAPLVQKPSRPSAPEKPPVPEDMPASGEPLRQPEQSAASGIGAEQVEARIRDQKAQAKQLDQAKGLAVTDYKPLPYDKIQVSLENGQVWRQLRSDRQRIRVDLERNQTVDIEESSLGGYRMRLNEMRRVIRVERVR